MGIGTETFLFLSALKATRDWNGQYSWTQLTQVVGATIANEMWRYSRVNHAVGYALATEFFIQSVMFAGIVVPFIAIAGAVLKSRSEKAARLD